MNEINEEKINVDQWVWKMEYCRKRALPPSVPSYWRDAQEAWLASTEKTTTWHNPAGVREDQIPAGWRLAKAAEIGNLVNTPCRAFSAAEDGFGPPRALGINSRLTYIVPEDITIKWHNPADVFVGNIPQGSRLLLTREVGKLPPGTPCQRLTPASTPLRVSERFVFTTEPEHTYITPLVDNDIFLTAREATTEDLRAVLKELSVTIGAALRRLT